MPSSNARRGPTTALDRRRARRPHACGARAPAFGWRGDLGRPAAPAYGGDRLTGSRRSTSISEEWHGGKATSPTLRCGYRRGEREVQPQAGAAGRCRRAVGPLEAVSLAISRGVQRSVRARPARAGRRASGSRPARRAGRRRARRAAPVDSPERAQHQVESSVVDAGDAHDRHGGPHGRREAVVAARDGQRRSRSPGGDGAPPEVPASLTGSAPEASGNLRARLVAGRRSLRLASRSTQSSVWARRSSGSTSASKRWPREPGLASRPTPGSASHTDSAELACPVASLAHHRLGSG